MTDKFNADKNQCRYTNNKFCKEISQQIVVIVIVFYKMCNIMKTQIMLSVGENT